MCAIDPERDIQFVLGPVDTLDHASRMQDFGSKMGIDATRKWPSEGLRGPWPDEIQMDAAPRRAWTRYGIRWFAEMASQEIGYYRSILVIDIHY